MLVGGATGALAIAVNIAWAATPAAGILPLAGRHPLSFALPRKIARGVRLLA